MFGGRERIRTSGWVTPSSDFESDAFNHSATLPASYHSTTVASLRLDTVCVKESNRAQIRWRHHTPTGSDPSRRISISHEFEFAASCFDEHCDLQRFVCKSKSHGWLVERRCRFHRNLFSTTKSLFVRLPTVSGLVLSLTPIYPSISWF